MAKEVNVSQWEDVTGEGQKWLFIPYKPTQTLSAGRYILLSDANTSYELDVAGDTGSISNGANVQLWSDTADSKYNSFDVKPLENGYYELIHVASGKALDVNARSTISGENIQLWDYHGGIAQQWAITPQGNGFMLRARCSGYAMDLEDGKLQNGQNVRQLFYNGSKAQTWRFVKAEYRVTYNAPEGSGVPAEQTKYYKQTLKISDTIPTRSGYRFVGWENLADLDGSMYYPGQTYSEDAGLILYAVWESCVPYTITYDANGGTNAPESQQCMAGTSVTLRSGTPTRKGYAFLGWALDRNTSVTAYAAGGSYVGTKDVTFYAVWMPRTYKVTFDSTGGQELFPPFMSVTFDGTYGELPEITKEKSIFEGWYTAASGGTRILASTKVTTAADHTLYAHWTKMPELILPASLTEIQDEAFMGNPTMIVSIPENCAAIGSKAFANCANLTSVRIPRGTTRIAADAFDGDANLTLYCYQDSAAHRLAEAQRIPYVLLQSDWVLAENKPAGATTDAEKWTYTLTTTAMQNSTAASMDGYTPTGFTWQQTGSGTWKYASYPAGFDTGSNLYSAYNKSALSASSTATTKREVSKPSLASYIYWHWTFVDSLNSSADNSNVIVNDARAYGVLTGNVYRDYIYFDAFESTTDYGTVGPGKNGDIDVAPMRYAWRGNLGDVSHWWWRFEVYQQSYTDYQKLFTYVKTTVEEKESSTAVTESDTISNVRHWVKYSF